MSPMEEGEKKEERSSRKQRKGRTRLMFTRAQTRELERLYAIDKYPKIRERRLIAHQMNIAERRVQVRKACWDKNALLPSEWKCEVQPTRRGEQGKRNSWSGVVIVVTNCSQNCFISMHLLHAGQRCPRVVPRACPVCRLTQYLCVQIWFQNRRAKEKREGHLMSPVYNNPNEFPSHPNENVTVSPSSPLTPPSDAETFDMNRLLSTQLFEPPSLPSPRPPPAHLPDAEFDPGYPDVDGEVSQPVEAVPTSLCLPIVNNTGQILFFPAPFPLPSPLTPPGYGYTTLWSKESVVNPKELEELLITLLSSHMPKTLHATDGHRLEAFKGFATEQCNQIQELYTKYQTMLYNIWFDRSFDRIHGLQLQIIDLMMLL